MNVVYCGTCGKPWELYERVNKKQADKYCQCDKKRKKFLKEMR